MAENKKVLIIAYSFPPSGEVAVYRTLKFSEYLPESGWQPVVLTVSNGRFMTYDASLERLIPPGLPVYRAPSFELFNDGFHRGKQKKPVKRTFWDRVFNRISMTWGWFTIPDRKVTWVPCAVMKGLQIVRREKIRHVYVTGKPFSAFIVGCLLKKLAGTTLTIDYRDPWTQNITYESRSPLHRWVERKMEAYILRRSDVVIANTDINEEMLVEDFGQGLPRNKFITIHNGFDREEFAKQEIKKYEKFTITYAGAFYFSVGSSFKKSAGGDQVMRTYSPFYFFEALKKLITEKPEIKDKIQVNFMGVLGHGFDSIIKEMGLEGMINKLGYIDYDEHIAVLKRSHALLLVLSGGAQSRGWVPSKFYQYMGSGNPVLALAPEGEVRNILRRTNGGIFVEPDDVEGVFKALLKLYDEYYLERRPFERNEEEVEKFERRHLTSLLASALDRIQR